MRKSRFTDEQFVGILRKADQGFISAVAKKQGGSEQAIYTWCKRLGAFEANDVRRLKQLEAEKARLVAERDLEIEVIKEIVARKWRACRCAIAEWHTWRAKACCSGGLAHF